MTRDPLALVGQLVPKVNLGRSTRAMDCFVPPVANLVRRVVVSAARVVVARVLEGKETAQKKLIRTMIPLALEAALVAQSEAPAGAEGNILMTFDEGIRKPTLYLARALRVVLI